MIIGSTVFKYFYVLCYTLRHIKLIPVFFLKCAFCKSFFYETIWMSWAIKILLTIIVPK